MEFEPPLKPATFIKRYKRFFADASTPAGDIITLHCPNTGSMRGCGSAGDTLWYSTSDNPKRKLPYTWELVQVGEDFIGVHTTRANHLVAEALAAGHIHELAGFTQTKAEVTFTDSRFDFCLGQGEEKAFVEVKSVTLCEGEGRGFFPDAVTTRGQKHLQTLMAVKHAGYRAVLLFCVQHTGIRSVAPADHIDPVYGKLLREAIDCGVEVLAYGVNISPQAITLDKALPVVITEVVSVETPT